MARTRTPPPEPKKGFFSHPLVVSIITAIVVALLAFIVDHYSNKPEVKNDLRKTTGDVTYPAVILHDTVLKKTSQTPNLLINYDGEAKIIKIVKYHHDLIDTVGLAYYTKNIGSGTAKKIKFTTAIILPERNYWLTFATSPERVDMEIISGGGFTQLQHLDIFNYKRDTAIFFINATYLDTLNKKHVSKRCLLLYYPSVFGLKMEEMPDRYYKKVKSVLSEAKVW